MSFDNSVPETVTIDKSGANLAGLNAITAADGHVALGWQQMGMAEDLPGRTQR